MKRNLCAKLWQSVNAGARLIMIIILSCLATNLMAQTYTGKASYYGDGFHGRKSASGKVYDMYRNTCAHKTLPFGTKLKVTNLKNGKSTIVEVTDRGPYAKGRIIDVSKSAAMELGMVAAGVAKVEVEVLKNEPLRAKVDMILYEPEVHSDFKAGVPRSNLTMEWAKTIR